MSCGPRVRGGGRGGTGCVPWWRLPACPPSSLALSARRPAASPARRPVPHHLGQVRDVDLLGQRLAGERAHAQARRDLRVHGQRHVQRRHGGRHARRHAQQAQRVAGPGQGQGREARGRKGESAWGPGPGVGVPFVERAARRVIATQVRGPARHEPKLPRTLTRRQGCQTARHRRPPPHSKLLPLPTLPQPAPSPTWRSSGWTGSQWPTGTTPRRPGRWPASKAASAFSNATHCSRKSGTVRLPTFHPSSSHPPPQTSQPPSCAHLHKAVLADDVVANDARRGDRRQDHGARDRIHVGVLQKKGAEAMQYNRCRASYMTVGRSKEVGLGSEQQAQSA